MRPAAEVLGDGNLGRRVTPKALENSSRPPERESPNALFLPFARHSGERATLWISLGIAVLLHGAVLSIRFPEIRGPMLPAQRGGPSVVRPTMLPRSAVERWAVPRSEEEQTRRAPLPDPTPWELEPIREPQSEFRLEPLSEEVELLVGAPEPPPSALPGPLFAGMGGTTDPVRIEASHIQPEYPEPARVAKIEGNVILQGIIDRDGAVERLHVLSCNRPGLGFEDSSIAAVARWRYHPAMRNGRPVEVYFTIFIDFRLL